MIPIPSNDDDDVLYNDDDVLYNDDDLLSGDDNVLLMMMMFFTNPPPSFFWGVYLLLFPLLTNIYYIHQKNGVELNANTVQVGFRFKDLVGRDQRTKKVHLHSHDDIHDPAGH